MDAHRFAEEELAHPRYRNVSSRTRRFLSDVTRGTAQWPPIDVDQCRVVLSVLSGEHTLVCGSAGTGKSYLISVITRALQLSGRKFMLCAPTGCAAANIGGTTWHHALGIKHSTRRDLPDAFPMNHEKLYYLQGVHTFILDEMSMLSLRDWKFLERVWQRVSELSHTPMVQFVFVGDIYQAAPVARHTDPEDMQKYCFEDPNFLSVFEARNVHMLTRVYRQKGCASFLQAMRHVQLGKRSVKLLSYLTTFECKTFLPHQHTPPANPQHDGEMEWNSSLTAPEKEDDDTESDDKELPLARSEIMDRPILNLHGRNRRVEEENHEGLQNLLRSGRKEFVYTARCQVNPPGTPDDMSKLLEQCSTPRELHLCVGCPVRVTANVSVSKGVCNGTLGTVVGFHTRSRCAPTVPESSLSNDPSSVSTLVCVRMEDGSVHRLGSFCFSVRDTRNGNTLAEMATYPLRLAFASTPYAVQGLTIAGRLRIGKLYSSPGLVYTSLTRNVNPGDIVIDSAIDVFASIRASDASIKFERDLWYLKDTLGLPNPSDTPLHVEELEDDPPQRREWWRISAKDEAPEADVPMGIIPGEEQGLYDNDDMYA